MLLSRAVLEGVSSEVIGFGLVRCVIDCVSWQEALCAHLPLKAWLLKGRGVPRIRLGSVRVCYHGVSHSADERTHQAPTVQEHTGLRVGWCGFKRIGVQQLGKHANTDSHPLFFQGGDGDAPCSVDLKPQMMPLSKMTRAWMDGPFSLPGYR